MNFDNLNNKMNTAINFFEKELSSIRTSRANQSMLDNIIIDAYGSKTPINQLGNISVPDASTIIIQVWDNSLIKAIENGLIESNLGITPQSDGSTIRLPIPKLSEERRLELTKVASQYAENAKVSIRNIRRDALDELRNEEKDKLISQDDLKKQSSQIQKVTDIHISQIDEITSSKKSEIIKV
jgi:ribosome recycling factor